jgi:hypothetical protein
MRGTSKCLTLFLAGALAAGCGDGDTTDLPDAGTTAATWQRVLGDLPGALISVWGTSENDVWAVGGDPDGSGPMVVHFDGTRWTRHHTGARGDLWWVHGFGPSDPVYMGGKDGLILRWNGTTFEKMETPGNGTIFGMWGSAPDDLWAVGGDGAVGAFAWRYDGRAWRRAEGFPAGVAADHSIYKIWGSGNDDVWLVGTRGLAMRWNGSEFTRAETGTERTIFTVHSDGHGYVAVGGIGTGLILEHDGSGWRDATPTGAIAQTIGVCVRGDDAYVVGIDSTVMRRQGGAWVEEKTGLASYDTLHAVWIDPQGGVWAVGGMVLSFPLTDGVLLHKGSRILPTTVGER